MPPEPSLSVELIEHSSNDPLTGIGRYTKELLRHLQGRVTVRPLVQLSPPLTRQLTFLHYFPLGIAGHRPGSIAHFMEDVACSQMLWRPVHPAVATSHDLGMLVWPAEARMHRAFDRAMLRLSYLGLRRMDAVIAISEYSRRQLVDRLGLLPERVHAIHSGIDHDRFRRLAPSRPELFARYGLEDRSDLQYLLYVGSELPRKNLRAVLGALARLPESVRLLKIGLPGPARFRRATLRDIRRLGVDPRIVFLERVPEEDLVRFYNAADVYVTASFLEGFGQPILEAMACGLPVVCSNRSSLPEITGRAAILVDPTNERELAEALHRVLTDGALRDRMRREGLQRARRFSWERTAAEVTEVYRHVVTNTERAAGAHRRRSPHG